MKFVLPAVSCCFKKRLSRLFIWILCISILLPFFQLASQADSPAFTTKQYNVDVVVNSDQSYDITETITVDFQEESHGIYRYIPYKGAAYIDEGNHVITEQYYRADVTNVDTGADPFDTKTDNGYLLVKIGDKDKTLTGVHTYTIKYRYAMFDDGSRLKDQFYLNLLPTQWQTPIESSEITIRFPETFPVDYMNFYSGEYGSTAKSTSTASGVDIGSNSSSSETNAQVGGAYGPANVAQDKAAAPGTAPNVSTLPASTVRQDSAAFSFDYKDNTIVAQSIRTLARGEGVTVRVDLPEGYFTGMKTVPDPTPWIYGISGGVLLLMLLLWLIFGRDIHIKQTEELTPPDNMSPAEMGYYADGTVDTKDLVSLLLYWGNRGFLTIEQLPKQEGEKRADFRITQALPLPPNAKDYEKTLYDGLFENGSSILLSELDTSFYTVFQNAKQQLTEQVQTKRKSKAFTTSSAVAQILGLPLLIGPLLAVNIWSAFTRIHNDELHYGLSVLLCIALLAGAIVLILPVERYYSMSRGKKAALFFIGGLLCAGSIAGFVLNAGAAFLNLSLVAAASTVPSLLLILFMRRRPRESAEKAAKISGFRKTLLREQQESGLDSGSFYKYLPYAYVLGIEEAYAKQFERIAAEPPAWLMGDSFARGGFNPYLMIGMVHSFHHSAQHQIISISAHSQNGIPGASGGSFGGGGFSGGGVGGGGGGSW